MELSMDQKQKHGMPEEKHGMREDGRNVSGDKGQHSPDRSRQSEGSGKQHSGQHGSDNKPGHAGSGQSQGDKSKPRSGHQDR